MVKRKLQERVLKDMKAIDKAHSFTDCAVLEIRDKLVQWFRKNKRDLPWRKQALKPDLNQRAYAVWVSEIMLQQTQVATVIDYYNKWMKKWPTIESLAASSLEEVNEMWSGLGYYSRGRRLFEGAKKVVEELNGEMPKDAENLVKELPGVGKYTAGAIASIAYNQKTGLVDGNVIRVLCRLCMIGADSSSQQVTDTLWSHANTLVDPESPGDFNQGLMELGATVCTPKGPDCSSCPLRNNCKAYAQVEREKQISAKALKQDATIPVIKDIECLTDNCQLCLQDSDTWDPSLGVMNYPRKGRKKSARQERTAVCVLCRTCQGEEDQYFIVQRPEKGLLAGLWEFPSITLSSDCEEDVNYGTVLEKYSIKTDKPSKVLSVGEVVHIFSHIHQTYVVEGIIVDSGDVEMLEESESKTRWVTRQEFQDAAVSTAMKKVLKAFETAKDDKPKDAKKQTKRKLADMKNQKSINMFFKPTVTS